MARKKKVKSWRKTMLKKAWRPLKNIWLAIDNDRKSRPEPLTAVPDSVLIPPQPHYDGSAPNRREKLLAGIDVAGQRGLEIAPLTRATVAKSEGDITYIDRNDTATLVERHKNDLSIAGAPILPVDVAVGGESLPVALAHLPKFDYIIASHVVEHIPNLIDWFEELRGILNPGGSVRLAVPDKRYTFDYLRTETIITEVLDSYIRGNRHPSSHSVIDQLINSRHIDLVGAWDGKLGDVEAMEPVHTFEQMLECANAAATSDRYHEVHCWAFTPSSFANLFADLGRFGMLNFECAGHFDTVKYSFEFFVNMVPSPDRDRIVQSWRAMAKACSGSSAD